MNCLFYKRRLLLKDEFRIARPAAWFAPPSHAVVLADARPTAGFARASCAVVFTDVRPVAGFARASAGVLPVKR